MKRLQNIKYFLKKDCGSALLEFALIAPILFLLFAGIVQFGFIINAKVVVNSASYEGARAATMSDDPESGAAQAVLDLSLIHISEPTRRTPISYAVFCLKKKKKNK